MPEVTQEKRTVMYSVEENGHVARHVFPFNAEDPMGMTKLMKFVRRGFTFDDPRADVKTGRPQVIVTREVELARPEEEVAGATPEPSLSAFSITATSGTVEKVFGTADRPTQETASLPDLICSECGRGPFKSEFGLEVHKRTCKKKNK